MKTRKKLKEEPQNVSKGWSGLLPAYHACVNNAERLLNEAEILFDRKRYARAFFLAFTTLEELSKAQIVADYLTDCISQEEFLDAFKRHDLKVAYLDRCLLVPEKPSEEEAMLEYDLKSSEHLIKLRMASLYVRLIDNQKGTIPDDSINRETAMEMITEAKEHFGSMLNAVWPNQRIGSKGLFK